METLPPLPLIFLSVLFGAGDLAALGFLLTWPERVVLSARQQLLRNMLLSCWITLNGFLFLRTLLAWLDDGQPFYH